MIRQIFFALTLAAAFAARASLAQERESAQSILKKMEATYSAAQSYSDTTSVRYRNPDGSEGASAECKIWFVRPRFRIDGESRRAPDAPPKRDVIWSDGETARSWSAAHVVTLLNKIQLAGSKMFGTYAYHIPTLLDSSYGGPRRLHQLASAETAGEEEVDGVACDHTRGDWQGDAYDVWTGKADHLVRKIVADYSGYRMEEAHRDIRLDQPIDQGIFHFVPEEEIGGPAKKGTPPPRLPGEHERR